MAEAGTTVNSGYSPAGTNVRGGATPLVVVEIIWTMALVANAFVAPTDTPTAPTMRVQEDAAGRIALFLYSTRTGSWKAVELA